MRRMQVRMTGGEALAQQLVREGVSQVFGVPGVQLDFAVDGLAKVSNRIAYWNTRHEQATSYMADGHARASGQTGACMVAPDPGRVGEAAALLCTAERPAIDAGGGVVGSGGSQALRALAEYLECPVVMSPDGRGALDDRHPLALTWLAGRAVLADADLVLG